MKKLLLPIFIFLFSFITLQAQDLNLDWANHSGGTGIDQVYSVNTDANGNVYTVGYFEDTVDFDPGAGIHNLISKGQSDIFVQKLDNNGNLLWAKSIGGVSLDRAFSASLDINNNLLVTGLFRSTIDFDPDTGKFNLISNGSNDLFILKLNSNGSFNWALSIGNQSSDVGFSIDCESNGNILLTGSFSNTVDFDPDTSTYNLSSNGYQDIFILKLDSNGKFIWATAMGGPYSEEGRKIILDSHNNLYSVGYYNASTVDFDPGPGTAYLPFKNSIDIYIQKLSPMGNLLWVRGISGINNERPYDIKIDLADNVYTTGYYEGTIDFDPDSIGVYNMTSLGAKDVFLQKLDSSGNLLWAKSMGSNGDDQGFALAIDKNNNVYTSGFFEDTVDFNPDTLDTFNLVSNGDKDIFIQKLDENGNFLWAESFGGTGWDQTRSILVDKKGSIFATGYFEATVDFDPDTNASVNLSSNGGNDHFLIKINQCNHSYDTLVISSCNSYNSPSGKLWTQSGTYSDTILNNSGCDSLMTINLTITNIDTTITVINNLNLFANDTLASYQWLDCNNGFSPIMGDTNRAFVATANGDYAVELRKNGCTDTSECIQVLTVGLNNTYNKQNSIALYPNPNNGNFTVSVSPDYLSKNYQILDISGRVVEEAQFTQQNAQLDLSAFGKGIYFMRVIETGWSRKIVVVE